MPVLHERAGIRAGAERSSQLRGWEADGRVREESVLELHLSFEFIMRLLCSLWVDGIDSPVENLCYCLHPSDHG